MKTIWDTETGKAMAYESVDAREILKSNSERYTDVDPEMQKGKIDKATGRPLKDDGTEADIGPQNVANVENEFRREPVGDNNPAPERAGTIIRNPVTDQPLMARPASEEVRRDPARADTDLDGMTVPELRDYAADNDIDLTGLTTKADIRAAIDKA